VSTGTHERVHVRDSGEVMSRVLLGMSHEELPGSANMQSRRRSIQYRDLYYRQQETTWLVHSIVLLADELGDLAQTLFVMRFGTYAYQITRETI